MNKSKFLKKSLAMLLALMLVLAMIPLSASAAATDHIIDLYVNGVKAGNDGSDNFEVTVKSTTIGISAATKGTAEIYYATSADDKDGEEILGKTIDLADCEKIAENQYRLYILAKVKENAAEDDYQTVEQYPLTVTVPEDAEPSNDSSMLGLANLNTTWRHMTNYVIDNTAQTITVTFEFGYDGPEKDDLKGEDFAPGDYLQYHEIDVNNPNPEKPGSIAQVAVKAKTGSVTNYDLYYEFEPAFESFDIPGQTGETEFVYNGQYHNEININVPYNADDDYWNTVIPTYTLVEEFADLYLVDNSKPNSTGYISGETKVNMTGTGATRTFTFALEIDPSNDYYAAIELNVTIGDKNPEGVLNTITVTDVSDGAIHSNETEITAPGANFVELPQDTDIEDSEFIVKVSGSRNASVVLVDNNGKQNGIINEFDGVNKYYETFYGVETMEGQYFTVQVTPQAGGDPVTYSFTLQAAKKAEAKLNNVVLKDMNTGDYYEATSVKHPASSTAKGEIVVTVPYSWINKANTGSVAVYMTASTGATIINPTHLNEEWRFNGGVDEGSGWLGYNRLNDSSWVPTIGDKNGMEFQVKSSDADNPDTNTYTVKFLTETAKTGRAIESAEYVGVNTAWAVTESNTFKTEIGEAKLDGNTVRTIEVTLPYSYSDNIQEKSYLNTLTLSEGAKAYYPARGTANTGAPTEINIIDPSEEAVVSPTDPTPFTLNAYEDGKDDDGNLVDGEYLPIYILSEAENVNLAADVSAYKDQDNASIYYLVAKRAPAETGNTLESIESTLDPNITTKLEGNTITINVPSSYATAGLVTAKGFTLNFETSKLATVYANSNPGIELKSDLGNKEAAKTATEFLVLNTGKLYNDRSGGGAPIEQFTVKAEDGDTNVYAVKIKVNKPETGASITALSVNGTAATIARDKIHVQLPLGSKLFPVSLDITASKMAQIKIDDAKYDPDGRYDVNDAVKITVISEDGETTNTYTLTASVSEGFNDVPTSEWYYDEVMTAANAGWINGTKPGYFEPNGTMTRGDFAVIIARILGCDTEATVESKFPDCNETDYFNAAVTFCKLRGIIDGDDKGYFNPYDAITREEMAKILCNALELDELETSANPFDDDAEIAQWAKGYVNAVQAEGIMEGSNGSFNPRDNATRAEGAAVLVRAFA